MCCWEKRKENKLLFFRPAWLPHMENGARGESEVTSTKNNNVANIYVCVWYILLEKVHPSKSVHFGGCSFGHAMCVSGDMYSLSCSVSTCVSLEHVFCVQRQKNKETSTRLIESFSQERKIWPSLCFYYDVVSLLCRCCMSFFSLFFVGIVVIVMSVMTFFLLVCLHCYHSSKKIVRNEGRKIMSRVTKTAPHTHVFNDMEKKDDDDKNGRYGFD